MKNKEEFIIDKYLEMSDSQMGVELGLTKDKVRHLRNKLGLRRDGSKFGVIPYNQIKTDLIKDIKKYAPVYKKITYKKNNDGHLLVIDPADIHIGKLSVKEETGFTYNIEEAKIRAVSGVMGIVNKSKGFKIDKILLIIGNDIIHIDTPFRATTSGTPQDTDGQWWQMFREAKDLYIEIIEHLQQVAPVHVVYNPSNHDYSSGFMLADTISSWFSKNKNITFDVSISHRKYFLWGTNLISTSHGDGAKETDMPILMASEKPDLWAKSKFRYIYLHHIHHKKQIKWKSGEDYHGATVEYLRSPSEPDAWHDRNGFTSVPKAVEGFVHSKENGQVARITHYY